MIVVVLGGARSGKSEVAERRIAALAGPAPVTYVATGSSDDPGWVARVARHRDRRPTHWTTVGAGADLAGLLRQLQGPVLLDSLGPWLAAQPIVGRAAEAAGASVGGGMAVRSSVDGSEPAGASEVSVGGEVGARLSVDGSEPAGASGASVGGGVAVRSSVDGSEQAEPSVGGDVAARSSVGGSERAGASEASVGGGVAVRSSVDGSALAEALVTRTGDTVVVSDEVGLSVHPPTAAGRWFTDALGTLNQAVAAVADEAWLVVAGRVTALDAEPTWTR